MKIAYQTLVVNLPMKENTITCQEQSSTRVAPHFQEQKSQDKRLKMISHKRVSCVMFKMRRNILYLYQSMTFELKLRSLKQPTRLTIRFTLFFTLTARKCHNMSKKRDVKPFWGRRWLFLGKHNIENQTLALLGLLQAATHAKWPQHTATRSRKHLAFPGDVLSIKGKCSICSGWFPLGRALPKCPGWNVLLSSRAMVHHSVVLSLPPSNHLMGSSAPWRSELIISPCVPVHWYLSVGYGPAHQKLRPPWAHHSSRS